MSRSSAEAAPAQILARNQVGGGATTSRTGRLRFCMLTTFYPPFNFGGDGIGIQRLCRGLARRGHHVTVIHDADAFLALNGGREPAPAPAEEGIELISLRSRLGTLSCLLTQQTGRPVVHGAEIRRLVAAGNYDVINFHNISLVGGPGILAVGDGLKVMMAHEHWLVCPSHVLWRHDREPCTGRECTRCVLTYRRPPQLWRYTGYLERQLEHVDLFIAMSEFSRQKHAEFGFPKPMEVLPYFLPDADLRAGRAEAPTGDRGTGELRENGEVGERHGPSPHARPYFLFVGRLERIKGLEDVIEAFRGYPDADLVVAGSGTHEAALKAQAAGLANVRFLGRLGPDELAQYYAHAIALVVPSVGFETFGIILIEAFRSGLPVIARRLGPFPEIVERAKAGLLFSTPAELMEALQRFQRDPSIRERFAANGRVAFQENWSESVVVPRYLELLRKAAERGGRSRVAQLLTNEVMS